MTDPYRVPPQYPHPGMPPSYGPPPAPPTNVLAILALVFGILGGLLAIPFGHIARSQIRRTGEGGSGLALAGLILGYLWLAASIAAVIATVVFLNWLDKASTDTYAGISRGSSDYAYSAPTYTTSPYRTPTYTATPTTRSAPSSTPRSTAPSTSTVSGTDSQGFRAGTGPRCNASDPAVAIGRTAESLVTVCRTGAGRYYYKGMRRSDGSAIELDDPTPTSTGFVAVNGKVRYTIGPDSLVITQGGSTLSNEPMLAYWSR